MWLSWVGGKVLPIRSTRACYHNVLAVHVITIALLLNCFSTSAFSQAAQTVSSSLFAINFISIGSGVDYKAEQKFSDYLSQFQKENKVKLQYTIEHWGKEGETKYTFDLKKLSGKQRNDLKANLTTMFKKNKLVQVEDTPR